MREALAIAGVTVREVLRRRLQVNLLFFGAALVVASHLVGTLTLGYRYRVLADLGLTSMQLIGLLVAVFVGSSLVAGDMERRVLQPVLAKPVPRAGYVLGRYLGLAVVLVLNLAVMAVLLGVVLALDAGGLGPLGLPYLGAVGLLAVQFLVVGAVAVLFSSISSATLAAVFSMAVAIAGQMTGEIRALWKGGATWVPKLIWYVVPNLSALNANEPLVYGQPPPAQAWTAAAYGLCYAAAALALAVLAFERRDLR
ncbi:MAG TPA: ABC transporter permease [Anaeromyxobacteraceae bacterium]|nr:ABC transporter permease [Anaeromyxobacteraceae bacterium]